jgi:hypothetical protein
MTQREKLVELLNSAKRLGLDNSVRLLESRLESFDKRMAAQNQPPKGKK